MYIFFSISASQLHAFNYKYSKKNYVYYRCKSVVYMKHSKIIKQLLKKNFYKVEIKLTFLSPNFFSFLQIAP